MNTRTHTTPTSVTRLSRALTSLLPGAGLRRGDDGSILLTLTLDTVTLTRTFDSERAFERHGVEVATGLFTEALRALAIDDDRPRAQHTTDMGMGRHVLNESGREHDACIEHALEELGGGHHDVTVMTTGSFHVDDLPLDLSEPSDFAQSFRIGEHLERLSEDNALPAEWREDDQFASRHATTRIDQAELARRMKFGSADSSHAAVREDSHATLRASALETTSMDELLEGDLMSTVKRALSAQGYPDALAWEIADGRVSIQLALGSRALITNTRDLRTNLFDTLGRVIEDARAKGALDGHE